MITVTIAATYRFTVERFSKYSKRWQKNEGRKQWDFFGRSRHCRWLRSSAQVTLTHGGR